MSEFSNFCKLLREKSGMTIYQIAKVSGMERTALNRMILGKRFPKRQDMELFCEGIRANEKEKDKLRELYVMEKLGRRRYENGQYIKQLLEELDQDTVSPNGRFWLPDRIMHKDPKDSRSFIQGREEVEEFIYYVIEQAYCQENVLEIYTNFPVKEKMLSKTVYFCSDTYEKDITLVHFLIMNVNPEKYYDADCNLKILHDTLLWKFREGENYIPYYTYSPIMLHDLEMQLMPYYLVTGSCVLFVSSDFQQGILLDDPQSVAFYHRKMKNLCGRLEPLYQLEGKRDNGFFSNNTELMLKHLNIEVYEKAVRIGKSKKSVSVVIKESSLCEAFHDFSAYITEIKNSAHGSAHIEDETIDDI